ncbi:MAG: hypothetical protein J7452_13865, partial [Thermoflexus sp.]|nr:hypothetical protein [Thermoflexus sp.]
MAAERRPPRGYALLPALAYQALGQRSMAAVWVGVSLALIGLAGWRGHPASPIRARDTPTQT